MEVKNLKLYFKYMTCSSCIYNCNNYYGVSFINNIFSSAVQIHEYEFHAFQFNPLFCQIIEILLSFNHSCSDSL